MLLRVIHISVFEIALGYDGTVFEVVGRQIGPNPATNAGSGTEKLKHSGRRFEDAFNFDSARP